MELFIYRLLKHFLFGHRATTLFLRGLKQTLCREKQSHPEELINIIKKAAAAIYTEHHTIVKDAASQGHLEFVSHILAAYNTLLPQLSSSQVTIALLKRSMMQGFNRPSVNLPLRFMLWCCRNNPDRLKTIFSWMMKQYGATFNWSTPYKHQPGQCKFSIEIDRCFYFEFFNRHNLPALTTVLCQLDALWFEVIDPAVHGLYFDRSCYQTQGYGAKTCIFPIVEKRLNKLK